jgi:hypothetical protein
MENERGSAKMRERHRSEFGSALLGWASLTAAMIPPFRRSFPAP